MIVLLFPLETVTSLKIDELTKLKLSRSVICQVNNDRLVSYDRGLPVVLVTLAIIQSP